MKLPVPEVTVHWRKWGRTECSACFGRGTEYKTVPPLGSVTTHMTADGGYSVCQSFSTQAWTLVQTQTPCLRCGGSGKVWGFANEYD